jgi:riboflavin kinase/FMN adenylyltransferase
MEMLNFSTSLVNDKIDSIAIGGFDGIHKAHESLISNLSQNGAIFVINRSNATITPSNSRERYTDKDIFLCDFEVIKDFESKEFIDMLISSFPKLSKIVVGYDFHFAKGRSCDVNCLKRDFDGVVVVVDEIKIDGISVHSSTIREFIKVGQVKKANMLLGRNYSIEGQKIKGQGIGSKKLVSTVNLVVEDYILPKEGVYKTLSNGYKSISFLGHRVTTDGSFAIETHLLESFEDIDRWEIEFIDFMRENIKFDTIDELKDQIQKDIDAR